MHRAWEGVYLTDVEPDDALVYTANDLAAFLWDNPFDTDRVEHVVEVEVPENQIIGEPYHPYNDYNEATGEFNPYIGQMHYVYAGPRLFPTRTGSMDWASERVIWE